MMTYLLQVSTCWIVFYGIYILFLQKETFFSINRYYLLSALVIGLWIPFIGGYLPANQASTEIHYAITQIAEIEVAPQTENKVSIFTWTNLFYLVYILGALLVFSRFIFGLSKIYSIYKNASKTKSANYTLVESTKYHLPFSFFHFIFISKELPLHKDVAHVLKHEELHANQWHSLDIVLTELLQVFFWFNPIIILYKNALKQSHEYLADAYVTKDHNRSSYGQLLLRQSTSGLEIALANHFFHSQIKKRITMLYKEKSKRPAMVKYLAAIPVLIAMLIIFSSSQKTENVQEQDQIEASLEEQGDPIFKVVEEMPRFPGCEDLKTTAKEKENCARQEMLNFIYQNMTYPTEARNSDIQGMCVVDFVIEKDGSISTGNIRRDIGGGCGQEALRVVNTMPKWRPAHQKGKPVRVRYTLPVKFKLEGDKKSDKKISDEQKNFMANVTAFGKKSDKATKENLVINKDGDQINDSDLYKVVEEMPRFPGCEDMKTTAKEKENCAKQEMLNFIYQNIKYPKEARDKGVEGVAVIQLIIEKDGSVSSTKILRDPGAGIGTEAIRVADLMPKWIPGKQRGKTVRIQYTLPVKFKLEGETYKIKKSSLNIERSKFIKLEKLSSLFNVVGLNSACKVQKYRFVHVPKGINPIVRPLGQDNFNNASKVLVENAQEGDLYFMEDIYCLCPGEKEAKNYGGISIKIEKDKIEKEVDQKPLFPKTSSESESADKLLNFVFSNVKYPEEAVQNNIEGTTVVKFIVDTKGDIQNIKVVKSPGWGIEETVLGMMDKMKEIQSPWTPARINNESVNYEYVLPVKFKLEDKQKEEAKLRKLDVKILNIKPNPSSGIFTLSFDIKDKTPADVTFYSLTGQKLKSMDRVKVPFNRSINLTDYKGQTVILRIVQNDKIHTEKIIIQ